MSGNLETPAPNGRKKIAIGKECSDALARESKIMSSPEVAKQSGWPVVPLGEVADINPRFGKDELTDDSLASFIPMKCVEEETGRFEPLGDRKVANVRKGYTPFRDGDVIFAKVTPCMENGKAAVMKGLTNGIGFGSTEFFAIRPKNGLDAYYLLHFILQSSFRRDAGRNMTGAVGLRRVPKSYLEQQQIPLPSLTEQRRIVAEIEKQFTRLEAGVVALRRVLANLKRYRAAVLKAACEGHLVPTEAELARQSGREYETGAQLLARILTERRQKWTGRGKYKEPASPDTATLPQLPEGWTCANLDAAIVSGPQNGVYIPRELYGRGHPILRIDDYQDGWVRDLDELNKVTADQDTANKYQLHSGDLVINRVNSLTHLGKCLIVRETLAGALFESNMMKADLADCVDPRYVEFCLRSRNGRTRLTSGAKWAVNQASINQEDVKRTPLPLPPLAEQERIVAEVERRLSVMEELESVAAANLQRATRLRQSMLARAFKGEL